MKKILFSLVALVCSMSMNAQVVRFMKGNTVVAKYTLKEVDNVVIEDSKNGTAKRTGDIDVKWVQLWENGPKFAEYNVGAANNKPEDSGGYYCWGKSIDKDPQKEFNNGTDALTGTNDTATNLWGSNWRMPTQAEFEALVANCDFEWTTINDVNGWKFTGKGDYASNSIFFPAAGYLEVGYVWDVNLQGHYWSSTVIDETYVGHLEFKGQNYTPQLNKNFRYLGCTVRAVLNE